MDEERTIENDWESQLAEYMLGTMESGAAAEFERGLVECRTHVTLAQDYSQVIGWMGAAAAPAEPPVGHKNRLLARVASTAQQAEPGRVASTAQQAEPGRVASTAQQAEPGRVATSAPSPIERAPEPAPRPDGRVTDITAYRERRRSLALGVALGGLAATFLVLAGVFAWSALLQQPRVQDYAAVQVKGQAGMPDASAVALVNPNGNDVHLVASGLQPLPAGQIYELWLLPTAQGAVPVPAGTFAPDATGGARHDASAPANLNQFAGVAVSVEQAPGLSAGPPKGPVVMVGTYSLH